MAVSSARDLATPLLSLLADGAWRAGLQLVEELRCTRAALQQAVLRVRALGIDVQALRGRGYRLAGPVELLDAARIRSEIAGERQALVGSLELLFEVDSTNSRLLGSQPPAVGSAAICMSEVQYAGRGRLGRRWIAPFGSAVALSLGWTCKDSARTLPGLSLGVGVAVTRALARAGAVGIALKWPNDIWFKDRKVGGILIELRAEIGAPTHVVIGVGVNVSLPASARRQIETNIENAVPVAAAADACKNPPSRNLIAGAILDELLSMLAQYERLGFAAYRDAWTDLDALNGRRAQVLVGDTAILGIARGVDSEGALLLETQDRVQRFVSGEASLRLAQG